MNSLSEKAALITGGAGEIGLTTAKAMINAGCKKISIVDIDEQALEEARNELERSGASVYTFVADISREKDVRSYISGSHKAMGSIDIFFNNAGIEGAVAPIIEYPSDIMNKVIDINVKGTFYGLKYVIPIMLEQGGGAIINTSSVAGLGGVQGLSAYSASKHAVIGLTRSAATEFSSSGIRINAICPSPVDNRMMRSLEEQASPEEPSQAQQMFEQMIPAGRYAKNEDIANVVVSLVSDSAEFIMGAVIPVDGGLSGKI